jgi:hypothetical protein
VLEKEYDGHIAHFKDVARKMTEEEATKKLTLTINMDEQVNKGRTTGKTSAMPRS